jgi:hypothetical protein
LADNFDAIKQLRENPENNEKSKPEEEQSPPAKSVSNEGEEIKHKNQFFQKVKLTCKQMPNIYNKIFWLALGFILLLFISKYFISSNKYELVSRNGQTYRLNKINGKVALLQNTRLISIDEPKNSEKLMINKTNIWEPKHIPQLDGLNIKLMTKWMDGKLYYQVRVSPYTKRLKKSRDNSYDNIYKKLIIKFQDDLGFDLLTVDIPIISMTGGTGNNGKIEGLTENGNVNCSFDIFKNIKDWDVEWNF